MMQTKMRSLKRHMTCSPTLVAYFLQ